MSDKKFLSTLEVQELYGLDERAQANLRHTRQITYTKVGKRCVYTREWVEEYFNKKTVQAVGVGGTK